MRIDREVALFSLMGVVFQTGALLAKVAPDLWANTLALVIIAALGACALYGGIRIYSDELGDSAAACAIMFAALWGTAVLDLIADGAGSDPAPWWWLTIANLGYAAAVAGYQVYRWRRARP